MPGARSGRGAREITSAISRLATVTRSFGSYSAVATEARLSRIFAGQHTRIDHLAGLELGHDVARFVLRGFRPGKVGLDRGDD
jgi:hypothetical protein